MKTISDKSCIEIQNNDLLDQIDAKIIIIVASN